MTAWVKKGTREEVGVIVDFVDDAQVVSLILSSMEANVVVSLTKYNMKLVEDYLSIPYIETKCGYACSDQCALFNFV